MDDSPPFQLLPPWANAHGVLAAVTLPDSPAPVDRRILEQLPEAEARHALTLRGYRQVQFVGGRLALRAARRQIGAPLGPVLADDRGCPTLPRGFVGSVSHKRTVAVAMVGLDDGTTLGVDVEDYGPPRPRIADRILRPAELEAVSALPEDRQWIATVLRFSIKESIYKAVDPYVRRWVGFEEAEVWPDLSGRAAVTLHLAKGEGPFHVDARYAWWQGRILTSVRIRPDSPIPADGDSR